MTRAEEELKKTPYETVSRRTRCVRAIKNLWFLIVAENSYGIFDGFHTYLQLAVDHDS